MVPDFTTVILTINRIMTSVQLSLQTPQSEEITCNHLAGLYILPSLLSMVHHVFLYFSDVRYSHT